MTRGIRAYFVPRWPTNPYQTELAKHLARFDVRVGDDCDLKEICGTSRRCGEWPHILHLHALPRLSLAPVNVARLMLFCRRMRELQRHGVKIVWTVHDVVHHEAFYPRLERICSRFMYHLVDAVIVHSAGARAMIERYWKVRRSNNVYVVPHGDFIDCYPSDVPRIQARARLDIRESELVFLFLGNIKPYKGVPALVDTFKGLSAGGVRLLIAGTPVSAELETEIASRVAGSAAIRFSPGFVSDDDVQLYMKASDVVVFPYTRALTSGALILAMSFGRACIAPRMGALGDTLDEEGGFVYDPDTPGALGRALREAIRLRARLAAMGDHNRRRVEKWSWQEAARLTADIYRGCMTSQRGSEVEESHPDGNERARRDRVLARSAETCVAHPVEGPRARRDR